MSRSQIVVVDTMTFERSVLHDHFVSGERVLIIFGSLDGGLTGDRFTVVAPSWHTATRADGWRLRDDNGGERSYVTAAPKYLIHIEQDCLDCVTFFKQLKKWLLPVLPGRGPGETHSYAQTGDGQIVHIADEIAAATLPD
ncbi:hypothetical protein [Streptomyces hainanensis]|uniref:Uncharacterized protein n=1 Tax=Streptomyces hainanensis TaxID=402648 RepID=A0A4R4T4N4_9ACTN|nr:hypothetical protein [Streptomyces hainanensis]TDC70274.1 hypothetical protein E1283_24915 [Streptomyces hainanensis]